MANVSRGDPLFHPCTSTQTVRYQNQSTCTCFPKKGHDKATETLISPGNERIQSKPAPVLRGTCTRCYSRRGITAHEVAELPEPYVGSTIRFYEAPESRDSSASSPSYSQPNLTPKDIMNTWMPGIEKPAEQLFPPSEHYVDVSPRDFSLRKYFPELFLRGTEKKEMRTGEQEQEQVQEFQPQQDECADPKCPQGNCSPRKAQDPKVDQDWRTMVNGPAIRTPHPWGEEDIALAQERDEVTNEELNIKREMPAKRDFKWFRWSCSKSKLKKKPTKKSEDKNKEL